MVDSQPSKELLPCRNELTFPDRQPKVFRSITQKLQPCLIVWISPLCDKQRQRMSQDSLPAIAYRLRPYHLELLRRHQFGFILPIVVLRELDPQLQVYAAVVAAFIAFACLEEAGFISPQQ